MKSVLAFKERGCRSTMRVAMSSMDAPSNGDRTRSATGWQPVSVVFHPEEGELKSWFSQRFFE